ncbi:MAG: flavin reductase family protein [Gemmatimonadota bacterium]
MTAPPDDYKRVLSHLAGGVVIVTTTGPGGELRGMTATAVCSVSVDPPLVMACMQQSATTHGAVQGSGVFALNILPASERDLAQRFASSLEDKFFGVGVEMGASGAPLLTAALAHCDCRVEHSVVAGDHTIFIGRVLSAASRDDGDRPLLYFRGDYGSVGPVEATDPDEGDQKTGDDEPGDAESGGA